MYTFNSKLIFTLLFIGFSANAAAGKVYESETLPERQERDLERVYHQAYTLGACKDYKGPQSVTLGAVRGQRLCYASHGEVEGYLVRENKANGDGTYDGNTAEAINSMASYLCTKGIEIKGSPLKVHCYDKRSQNFAPEVLAIGHSTENPTQYQVAYTYEGCGDEEINVSYNCRQPRQPERGDQRAVIFNLEIKGRGTCTEKVVRHLTLDSKTWPAECADLDAKFLRSDFLARDGRVVEARLR